MISLPKPMERRHFRAWRSDPKLWLPIAIDIAKGLSLPRKQVEVFSTGTNLVVGLGGAFVLKIYPPFLRHQYFSERTTLSLLKGRVSVAIPEVIAEGERDGWPYLVISRLHGELGTNVWPKLPEDQKEDVLRQIGRTIAEVQRAPLGDLASLKPEWSDFLQAQIANCRSRHIGLGLPAKFLDELDDLMSRALSLIPVDGPAVISPENTFPKTSFWLRVTAAGSCPVSSTLAT